MLEARNKLLRLPEFLSKVKPEVKEDAKSVHENQFPKEQVRSPSRGEPLPEISFSTFVMGLSTQALMHLGEIPNPVDKKTNIDFEGAKQMIDILGILQKKTNGNLETDEQALIEDVLYNLRMRYLEMTTKAP